MKRLYRSRSDEMIAGVCGGLADYLGVDPTVVRLVFVLLLFAGLGGLWIYLVLWIIMPLEPTVNSAMVEMQVKPEAVETKKVSAPKPEVKKKTAPVKKPEDSKS
ncbi:MAG TPA: PspC domain-containing protein [Pelolinea sp.]|nr:PspC domain-containing protein [Pelolinea sp.]